LLNLPILSKSIAVCSFVCLFLVFHATMSQPSAMDMMDQYDTGSVGASHNSSRRNKESRLGCGSKCMQVTILALNVVFVILGIALIVGGVMALHKPVVTSLATNDLVFKVVIGFGAFVFLAAIFGCYGAKRESRCWLVIYSLMTFVMIVAFIGAGSYTAAKRHNADEFLSKAWGKASDDARCAVQQDLNCIGWDTNWDRPAMSCQGREVPPKTNRRMLLSASTPIATTQAAGQTTPPAIQPTKASGGVSPSKFDSCRKVVMDDWKKISLPVVIVALALGFLLIVGLVMSCCLMKEIRRAYSHQPMESSSQYFSA